MDSLETLTDLSGAYNIFNPFNLKIMNNTELLDFFRTTLATHVLSCPSIDLADMTIDHFNVTEIDDIQIIHRAASNFLSSKLLSI